MPRDNEPTNKQLDRLLRRAGFVLLNGLIGEKELARAVSRVAAERGAQRRFTHTYVQRWLNGVVPRDKETPQYLAEAISRRLGRAVGIDELGFGLSTIIAPDLGVGYPADLATGLSVVGSLIQADLQDAQLIVASHPNMAAWNEAALSWLVRRSSSGADVSTHSTTQRSVNLAGLRSEIDLYEALDNRHGGGHGRRSLARLLHDDALPLLRETRAPAAKSELFRTSAEGMLTLAWMSYDSGLHGLGQRYFIQALRIAQEAGEIDFAASVLDAMSHQLTFLRRHREAANLAAAARMGSASLASPLLEAHFWIMEARAYAGLGEARACDQALSAGVRLFESSASEDGPGFIRYFGRYELDAELAHCNRDLGRANLARKYAEASLVNGTGDYARANFFTTMVLADAYLDDGELEMGCEVALEALDLGEQLKSARSLSYVDEFRERLDRFGNAAAAREFKIEAEKCRLWTPAA